MKKRIMAAIAAFTIAITPAFSGVVYADTVPAETTAGTESTGTTENTGTTDTTGTVGTGTGETTDTIGQTDTADGTATGENAADTSADGTGTDASDTSGDTTTDLTADYTDETVTRPEIGSDGVVTIAIDAGHGGSDPGAKANGLIEKELNLKIAKYVVEYLSAYQGIVVYETRPDDNYVGLEERVNRAKAAGADLFISIHNNAAVNSDGSPRLEINGAEVYAPNTNYNPKIYQVGQGLGNAILDEITALGRLNRSVQTRSSANGTTYPDGSLADYYSVVRNSKKAGIPGIIVEHGFLTGGDDSDFLSQEENLKAFAMADVKGIVNYLSLSPAASQTPNVSIFSPQTGAIELSWNEIAEAKGYLVYRSAKKDKGYKRVAKLAGSENTLWTDAEVPVGTSWYYKVKSYRYVDGYYIYSDYSDVFEGHTIGSTAVKRVLQKDNYIKLWWDETEGADGYQIMRKISGVGSFEPVTTVYGKNSFADRTVEEDTEYVYKVVPMHVLSGNESYGNESKIYRATYVGSPQIKRVKTKTKGRLALAWYPSVGVSGYEVYRCELEDGDYVLAGTTDENKTTFVDPGVEIGKTYYYRVKSIRRANAKYPVEGEASMGEPMGCRNFDAPVLYTAQIATDADGIYLQWSNVDGADEYRVYRSDNAESGFETVKKLKTNNGDVTEYTDAFDSEPGQTYYYKIKAGRTTSDGQYVVSEASNVEPVVTGYRIMGASRTDVDQMVRFYLARGGEYPELYADYGAPTIEDFARIVYEEAEAEGVKAEVVFGQTCKETGFLRFDGDVSPEQCNFAGIGATGGGVKGAAFPDVRTGIRAQVQHLKAYASSEDLNQECVDPRFDLVTRESAVYVEWLGISENPSGGGWATAIMYGYSMRDDYIKKLLEA